LRCNEAAQEPYSEAESKGVVEDEPELKRLMMLGLSGDGRAHHAFLSAMATRLRGFFRSRLGASRDDAEDLVQETLIALHTKRDTFDPSYPVTAWAYAIARYRLIDHWRRKKVRGEQVSVDEIDLLSVPAQDEASDAKRDVWRLLERLPQKQRDAIQLVKIDGVSVRDAAVRLGLSESDVKVSAHRGLKSLMRFMADEQS
jgi:RNA polymerase sigma-70 factor, ECF subfamily